MLTCTKLSKHIGIGCIYTISLNYAVVKRIYPNILRKLNGADKQRSLRRIKCKSDKKNGQAEYYYNSRGRACHACIFAAEYSFGAYAKGESIGNKEQQNIDDRIITAEDTGIGIESSGDKCETNEKTRDTGKQKAVNMPAVNDILKQRV